MLTFAFWKSYETFRNCSHNTYQLGKEGLADYLMTGNTSHTEKSGLEIEKFLMLGQSLQADVMGPNHWQIFLINNDNFISSIG